MEELQSTEVLEREILEDARKKALRLLKQADDAIAEKTAEWDKKTRNSVAEIENNYKAQREQAQEKIMARLPIDKLRAKVDRIETLIKDAAGDWHKSAGEKRVLELLTNELSKRLDICKGIRQASNKKAYFFGMEKNGAETVFKNSGIEIENANIEEAKSANPYPCIIIETNNTRIIVSIQNIIDYYLAQKREELVAALVGREFMERN